MKQKVKHNIKTFSVDILFDIAAGFFFALGIHTFALNANFATGGVSGMALISNHLWGFPLGLVTLLLNIPIAILSFKVLGKRFLFRSVVTMAFCAVMLDYVVTLIPVYTGNRLVAAICTGFFSGVGLSLAYMRKSSTGGTDFLVMTFKKILPHFSIGAITMIIDGIIISLGAIAFDEIDAVIYGMISTAVSTIVIDKIMYGIDSGKFVFIICDDGMLVSKAILNAIGRGVTVINGEGAFTHNKKNVLMCACSKNQLNKLRNAAYSADEEAFVIVTESNEVFGEGFKPFEE